jgi:hypothetical protein
LNYSNITWKHSLILKIHCVLKIFSQPRCVKNSPATSVNHHPCPSQGQITTRFPQSTHPHHSKRPLPPLLRRPHIWKKKKSLFPAPVTHLPWHSSRLLHSFQTHNSGHYPMHHSLQLLALSTPHLPNHCWQTRPKITLSVHFPFLLEFDLWTAYFVEPPRAIFSSEDYSIALSNDFDSGTVWPSGDFYQNLHTFSDGLCLLGPYSPFQI